MSGGELPTADVLGVEVTVGTVDTAADAVIARALSGEGGYAVLCNVHVLMTARKQFDVMDAIRHAWAVLPDGAPVAWVQRREGYRRAVRIGGPDLMPAVFDRGRKHGLRHALLGSTPAVLSRLQSNLSLRFPQAEIVAAVAPPIDRDEDDVVLAEVRDATPHVVWLALGAPKQELWMRRRAVELAPALVLGVGAAFDFHAGTRNRAPHWMRRVGLEWAHRLAHEPRRLGNRYMTTNAGFIIAVSGHLSRSRRLRAEQ